MSKIINIKETANNYSDAAINSPIKKVRIEGLRYPSTVTNPKSSICKSFIQILNKLAEEIDQEIHQIGRI